MVTGSNTDVRFEGHVYHVQTEDLGLDKAEIVSLVYVGGQILKSFRSPYADVAPAGEEAIGERLTKQHKTVVHAILRGRLTPAGMAPAPAADLPSLVVSPLENPVSSQLAALMVLVREERSFRPLGGAEIRIALLREDQTSESIGNYETDPRGVAMAEFQVPDTGTGSAELVVTAAVGDETTEARLPVAGTGRPQEVEPERIGLIVSDLEAPKAGSEASFMILVREEPSTRPVQGASVRMYLETGEDDEPVELYAATTGKRGFLLAECRIPEVESGSESSILIRARTDGATAEVVIPV